MSFIRPHRDLAVDAQPGLRPLGPVAAKIVDEVRLRRLVLHLHRLGPASLGHFLQEIAVEFDAFEFIEGRLSRYGQLDAEIVKALGADQFAPPPLHVVRED